MKTLYVIFAAMAISMLVAGCSTRSELAWQEANPDAYAATQGEDENYAVRDEDSDDGGNAEADTQLGGSPDFF